VGAIGSVPDDAAKVTLRLLPTGPGPGIAADALGSLWGACYADDFYFAPLAQAKAAGRYRAPEAKRSVAASESSLIDESLVLHYTFGLPGEQRIVRDRSPHGNDGKIVNKPESLPELDGRFGVLRFGGQETYIECGDDDSLHDGGDQTIEMWVRLNSLVRSKGNFAHIYGDADSSNFNFGVQNHQFLRLHYTAKDGSMLIPTGDILGMDRSYIAVVVVPDLSQRQAGP